MIPGTSQVGTCTMAKHLKFSLRILPFVFGMFVVMLLYQAERFFYPVITKFLITNVQIVDSGYKISGVYIKRRDCKFLGTNIIAKEDGFFGREIPLSHVEIDRHDIVADAPEPVGILMPTGNWIVNFPQAHSFNTISVYTIYKCHPLWITENKVLTIDSPPKLSAEGVKLDNNDLIEIFNNPATTPWYNP